MWWRRRRNWRCGCRFELARWGRIAEMRLDDLGTRICILGPSNSGKSTLAAAIAHARDLKAVHLDQLYHRPNTDWEVRPTEEFITLHDEAITGEFWVMDGNYSICMPQRFARATGLILLDVSTSTSLFRYFRRTVFGRRNRAGALPGGHDSLKWDMVHHIAVTTRANRKRDEVLFRQVGLPRISLSSTREIEQFYWAEGLKR
jgi:adenylate kinase family enzyme